MVSHLSGLRKSRLFFFLLGLISACVAAPAAIYCLASICATEPVEFTDDNAMNKELAAYLAYEGPAARGPHFLRLSTTLCAKIFQGLPLTEDQLRNFLGSPDAFRSDDDHRGLFFNYKVERGQEGAVVVDVRKGRVTKIMFGGLVKPDTLHVHPAPTTTGLGP
jgi:hypothetical protein